MTVDSKYVNLPWMARDESDVYETQDLPEVDQRILQTDDSSIEIIDFNVENAKKVFGGKNLNADNVDFSDRIRAFVNTGYSIDTNQYVLYPDNEKNNENPLERYQRLQQEVRDLVEDLEEIRLLTKTKDVTNHLRSNELLLLSKEMEGINSELECYKIHCSIGNDSLVKVAVEDELCGQESREMLEEIERYTSKYKKNDSVNDKLSWEKYYQSPLNKELDNIKLADLNQRVQRLQSTIGFGDRDSNITSLNCDTASKSLLESVKLLSSRCQSLKGGPNVDKIELRLVGLSTKLQSITEKRTVVTEADCQNKVAELFDLVEKWKTVQHVLPVVVSRLEDLKELHNQAIHFTDCMSFLDKNQKEMNKNIILHKDIITKIENQLSDNLKKIKTGIDTLQIKMENL